MEEEAQVHISRAAFVADLFHQVDHYKRLLLRFWWIPLLTLALGGAAQWFLLKHAPTTYASVSRMMVNVKVSIPDGNVYSEDVNNFFGTQVALMQSERVINGVKFRLRSSHPELHPAPVELEVTIAPKTSIFNLRATGQNAAYAQAYLQATMEEYISLKGDLIENASTATQSNMKAELKKLGVELQKSKEDVLNYQSSNNVVFLQPSGGNNAADYLSYLTRQLDKDKSDLQVQKGLDLDENLQRQRDLLAQPTPTAQPSGLNTDRKQEANATPGVVPRQNSTAVASAQRGATAATNDSSQNTVPSSLGDIEVSYLQTSQQLVRLQAQRERLNKTTGLDLMRIYGYTGTTDEMTSRKTSEMADLDHQIVDQESLLQTYKAQSLERMRNRQHILEAEIKSLEGQVHEWETNALDASKKLSAFEALKENERRVQTRYDQMQANLQRLEVDKGIGQESVTLLEPATPAVPVLPQAIKHLVMAGLTGLVLGLGILVLVDRLDDRAWSCTELEQLFDMPVLTQVPLLTTNRRQARTPILQIEDDRYPTIEAYRSLRSALLYGDAMKEQPKSLMITSARPNDGKSMVSANFAITLAQMGARVLLIDADLRRGVLHKHFSVAAKPGLAEVLVGECDWASAVVATSIPNLHLLPCGRSPRHPGNLFATAGKYLADIPRHHDYYVFDTAPVMVGDDVLSLAPHVDGLIMVVRAGFTSGRIAQAALDLLHLRGVKVIGLVFNAVHPKSSDYYYGRFKEYYPRGPVT
jgi:polysaccharide biosynthesis transport protein